MIKNISDLANPYSYVERESGTFEKHYYLNYLVIIEELA